jgi:hypothetical protein
MPRAQAGLEPAQESRPVGERLGILHDFTQHVARQVPLETAEAPPDAQREGQQGEAEERDGEDDAGEHGHCHEGQPHPGQGRAQQEEGEFAPHPLGERLVQRVLRHRLETDDLFLGHGKGQLTSADAHPHAAVVRLFRRHLVGRHASRRCSRTAPKASTAVQ